MCQLRKDITAGRKNVGGRLWNRNRLKPNPWSEGEEDNINVVYNINDHELWIVLNRQKENYNTLYMFIIYTVVIVDKYSVSRQRK